MTGPPPAPADWQWQQDGEHLRLLGILYYVSAALSGLGVLFGMLYVLFGMVGLVVPMEGGDAQELKIMSAIFGGVGVLIVVISAVWVVAELLAGRYLMASRNRVFCMVVAAITCMSFPLGTALGVFTFVVLSRPSVQARFAEAEAGRPAQGAANA